MVFTKMTHASKKSIAGLSYPLVCKGRIYFVSFDLLANIEGVAITNLVVVVLIILFAVFKACRRRCVTERVQFLPDWVLDKINVALCTAFIFMIQ